MSYVTARKICKQNDRFRNGDPSIPGKTFITSGVQALLGGDPECAAVLFQLVRDFNVFDEGNDPYSQHDFGSFDFAGEKVFWKIDYFAPDLNHGSEDPSDPKQTVRVLTILLAAEY